MTAPSSKPQGSEQPDIERAITAIRGEMIATTSFLQRRLRWGFAHANRVLQELCEQGFVTPTEKPYIFRLTNKLNAPLPNPSSDEEVERAIEQFANDLMINWQPRNVSQPKVVETLNMFVALLSQQHNAELSASCDAARNKLAEAQSEIDQLRATLAEKESKLATAQRDIAGLQNQLRVDSEGYQEVIASLRASLQTAMEERDKVRDTIDVMTGQLQKAREIYQTANSRLEEARTEIEKLKDHDIDSQTRHMLNVLLSRLSTSRSTENKT